MSDHNPNALKHMYGEVFLKRFAKAFSHFAQFDSKAVLGLKTTILKLEMKPRVLLVRDELVRQLPQEFPKALKIILTTARKGELAGFDYWPLTEFVQTHGLKHEVESLEALKVLTTLFTSEFAVRPFIQANPVETLEFLFKCAHDKNHHIRRWASEGSRPRLPWGIRLHHLIQHPELTLPILDALKFDEELYVRKSVANHLNDIAKDHPELVIKVLARWLKEAGSTNQAKILWIVRHALRTLIKQGNSGALKLLGVNPETKILLSNFKLSKSRFFLDEKLGFSFTILSKAKKSQKLVIDYKIHFQRSGDKLSEKVFKLKTLELGGNEKFHISKLHHLKEVTTRKHYTGTHYLEIMINGSSYKKAKWDLLK